MASSITNQAYTRQDMTAWARPRARGVSRRAARSAAQDEARPARRVGEAQLAAHLASQLTGDRQAEPEAAAARRGAAALEALEDPLAIVGVDAGTVVVDGDRGLLSVVGRHHADGRGPRRVAQGVVEQDPHHARHGAGIAAAPARPRRDGHLDLDVALGGPQLELGRHRAAQLAELDGLLAQRHVGVKPAEVEQLAGQPRQAPQLALGAEHLAPRILLIEVAVAQVLLQQLDRPLQRGQRRSQLVGGGRDERAPRRLLAAQFALHRRQGAGEVADLVAAVVARGRRVGSLLGDAHRGGPQAGEAAADPGRQRDAEQDGDQQSHGRRGEERRADLTDRGADVGEGLLRDQDEVAREVAAIVGGNAKPVERKVVRHVDGLHDDDLVVAPDRARHGVADRAQDLVTGNPAARDAGVEDRAASGTELATMTRASVRRRSLKARPAMSPPRWRRALRALALARVGETGDDVALEELRVGGRRVLEVVRRLVGQPALQWRNSASAATARVTTLVNTSAASSRGRRPKPRRLVTAPGSGSRPRGRSGSGSAPPDAPRASRADA